MTKHRVPSAPVASAKLCDGVSLGAMTKRIAAIIEVLFAFAIRSCHVPGAESISRRSGDGKGRRGVNFTPGVGDDSVHGGCVVSSGGRDFEAYGLTLRGWRGNMNIGLFWAVLMIALAGVGLAVTRIHFDASHPHNDMTGRLGGRGVRPHRDHPVRVDVPEAAASLLSTEPRPRSFGCVGSGWLALSAGPWRRITTGRF